VTRYGVAIRGEIALINQLEAEGKDHVLKMLRSAQSVAVGPWEVTYKMNTHSLEVDIDVYVDSEKYGPPS